MMQVRTRRTPLHFIPPAASVIATTTDVSACGFAGCAGLRSGGWGTGCQSGRGVEPIIDLGGRDGDCSALSIIIILILF